MKTHIEIRRMQEGDIPAAAALEQALFSDAWSVSMLESGLHAPSQHFFCACAADGAAAGYAAIQTVLDEAELLRIGVLPSMQGQGIGAALLLAALEAAREQQAATMLLEVRQGNAPAISLYQKYGFREAGIRRAYYQNPREDAVIMVRQL